MFDKSIRFQHGMHSHAYSESVNKKCLQNSKRTFGKSTDQVISLFMQFCLGRISALEKHWTNLSFTMIVRDLFYSDVFTKIKQYILPFNQLMFFEFVFGLIVSPFTQFFISILCIVQDTYVTKGHKLAHKVLTSQRNFIKLLYIQKRQRFYLIKKCKAYRQRLHQTKMLLKWEDAEMDL